MSSHDAFPLSDYDKNEARLAIHELESSANIGMELLQNAPIKLDITGYDIPAHRLHEAGVLAREFVVQAKLDPSAPIQPRSVDACIRIPTSGESHGIDNFTQYWTNSYSWSMAQTEVGAITYVSQGGVIIDDVEPVPRDKVPDMLRLSGLPYDELSGIGTDIESVDAALSWLIPLSKRAIMTRELTLPVDPATVLHVVHDARTFANEASEDAVIQELRFEVHHYEDSIAPHPIMEYFKHQTSFPVYANQVVLRLDDTTGQWKYKGTYEGRVRPGELLSHDYDTSDVNNLTTPNAMLVAKILSALENKV